MSSLYFELAVFPVLVAFADCVKAAGELVSQPIRVRADGPKSKDDFLWVSNAYSSFKPSANFSDPVIVL